MNIVYLGGDHISKIKVGATCKCCKPLHIFEVTLSEWKELLKYLDKKSDKKIQEIIPNVSDDIREIFISGICGKCFDKLFNMITM